MSESTSSAPRIACLCAAGLAIFVLWLATASYVNAGVAFFYAVPIGLATWWWGQRVGALAALVAIALYAIGAQVHPVPDFGVALALRSAAFVGVVTAVALLRARVSALEVSAEELEAIRAALTPSELPRLSRIDAAAAFMPSEYGVSGDFYLLTNGPDGAAVAIVGDISGHGPAAARLATFVRARFAAYAASTSDPAELLALANDALLDQPRRKLASAVCLRFQPGDGSLTRATAGHPPPLRLPSLEELAASGSTYLLGAEAGLTLGNGALTLSSGEGIVAYTDGRQTCAATARCSASTGFAERSGRR